MHSYWEKEHFLKGHDVIIVGAGLVGLSTAYFLKSSNSKLRVTVLERGVFPSGASTKNAGFACFGSISELLTNTKIHGEEAMLALVAKRWNGLKTLKNLPIDIDFNAWGGYEIFRESDKNLQQECLDYLPQLNRYLSAIFQEKTIFKVANDKIGSFGLGITQCLIENTREGQINTGKMMRSLAQACAKLGVNMLTGVEVTEISSGLVKTTTGDFQTERVVVAVNAFAKKLVPQLDVVPGRGQVLVTKPIKDLKIKGTFHYDAGYFYFRNIENRVLIGGGRNLDIGGEQTYDFGETEKIQSSLERILTDVVLPNQKFDIDYRWSGIMGFGKTMNPIIDEVEARVWCAVRGSGMGVALGAGIGKEVSEQVLQS